MKLAVEIQVRVDGTGLSPKSARQAIRLETQVGFSAAVLRQNSFFFKKSQSLLIPPSSK